MTVLDRAPEWLQRAEAELGICEAPGPDHNPKILEYLRLCAGVPGELEPGQLGPWAAGRDETPWCAAGLCWVLEQCGYPSPRDARARAFMDYGQPCPPRLGAITVIQRRRSGPDAFTGSRGGYHVGILIRQTGRIVRLYGANQGDAWRYSNFALSKWMIRATRWPTRRADVLASSSPDPA